MFDNGRLLLRKARNEKLHVSVIILYPCLNFSTIERHNWLKNHKTSAELRRRFIGILKIYPGQIS